MATNRKIKSSASIEIESSSTTVSGTLGVTGQSTLSGLAYPTSDGTDGQALLTNGSGVLSFGDAGSVSIDTIASASDATNYTGTARFISITSTADVTFTNATIKDRIIYCDTNITVKFQCDNFINNIVKMSHASSMLQIESKYDGGNPGASSPDLVFNNCSITSTGFVTLKSGAHDPSGSDEEPLALTVSSSDINASSVFLGTMATDPSDQRIDFRNSKVRCSVISNPSTGNDTCFIRFGSEVITNSPVGFFNVDNGGKLDALVGTLGSNVVKVNTGTTTYINSAYNYPFTAKDGQVQAEVIARATNANIQTISSASKTTIEFDTALTNISGCFDTTNDKFVCKVKGLYGVKASIYTYNHASPTNPQAFLMHTPSGGSIAVHDLVNGFFTPGYTDRVFFEYSDLIALNIGDEIVIQTSSSDSSYNIGTASTRFNIYKIN